MIENRSIDFRLVTCHYRCCWSDWKENEKKTVVVNYHHQFWTNKLAQNNNNKTKKKKFTFDFRFVFFFFFDYRLIIKLVLCWWDTILKICYLVLSKKNVIYDDNNDDYKLLGRNFYKTTMTMKKIFFCRFILNHSTNRLTTILTCHFQYHFLVSFDGHLISLDTSFSLPRKKYL